MIAQVRYSVAGRLRGRVASYAVCAVHMETRISWLSLKTKVDGLTSKPLGWFLRFGLKIGGSGFLVEPQNQGGGGFFGLGLKTGSYGLVIWASKSPRWFLGLGLKIK
jgi:hypothetical protein